MFAPISTCKYSSPLIPHTSRKFQNAERKRQKANKTCKVQRREENNSKRSWPKGCYERQVVRYGYISSLQIPLLSISPSLSHFPPSTDFTHLAPPPSTPSLSLSIHIPRSGQIDLTKFWIRNRTNKAESRQIQWFEVLSRCLLWMGIRILQPQFPVSPYSVPKIRPSQFLLPMPIFSFLLALVEGK